MRFLYLCLCCILAANVQAQNKTKLTPQTLHAFNAYIHLVNTINQKSNQFIKEDKLVFQYVNLSLFLKKELQRNPQYELTQNQKLVLKLPHLFLTNLVEKHTYPRTIINQANLKRWYLPKTYQASLYEATQGLVKKLRKREVASQQLYSHIRSKGYMLDNYATILKMLNHYTSIYDHIRQQLHKIQSIVQKALNNYEEVQPNTPFLKAVGGSIDEGTFLVNATQNFLYQSTPKFNPLTVTQSLTENLAQARQALSLSQNKYTKLAARLQKFAKLVSHLQGAPGKYVLSTTFLNQLIKQHNLVVTEYNALGKRTYPLTLQKYNASEAPIYDTLSHNYVPCDCNGNISKVNMASMTGSAPTNFMLLLDVSLSMKDALPMFKDSFKYLTSIMRPEDMVSVIVFSEKTQLILPPTLADKKQTIFQAIDTLSLRNGTNGQQGLKVAYDWIQKNYHTSKNNRIILATDGEFKLDFETYDLIGNQAKQGVVLSVFSFARQLKYYKMLQQMAHKGKGSYELVTPGNIAYKLVREAQMVKLPQVVVASIKNPEKPCDCNRMKVQKPLTEEMLKKYQPVIKKQAPPTKPTKKIQVTKKAPPSPTLQGFAHNNLMLLLDVSGSMVSKNKLPLLKQSLKYLTSLMRPEDDISIVIYAGDARIALKPTSASDSVKIHQVIDRLRSKGKTNVKAGFKLAYKWVRKNYKKGKNNRIVLATDGEFPITPYIYKMVEKHAQQGIHLSVFNFGKANQKDENLKQLVKKGKGNYEYIIPTNANDKLLKEAQSIHLR